MDTNDDQRPGSTAVLQPGPGNRCLSPAPEGWAGDLRCMLLDDHGTTRHTSGAFSWADEAKQ